MSLKFDNEIYYELFIDLNKFKEGKLSLGRITEHLLLANSNVVFEALDNFAIWHFKDPIGREGMHFCNDFLAEEFPAYAAYFIWKCRIINVELIDPVFKYCSIVADKRKNEHS